MLQERELADALSPVTPSAFGANAKNGLLRRAAMGGVTVISATVLATDSMSLVTCIVPAEDQHGEEESEALDEEACKASR